MNFLAKGKAFILCSEMAQNTQVIGISLGTCFQRKEID